ncbi:MAG: lipoyl(octanoyl) transferase LipB [Anaerolineales bacterium]|nr:lipoyl(octanoyl) transferase LipB [Anaerolineales bacterium]
MLDRHICQVIRLGQVDYQQAWDLQSCLADGIAAGGHPPALLLLEHPHTFTFGRRGHIQNLLWDQEELARRQVKVFWVDRGGDVTYHGPGQLVGYPLLPLARLELPGSGNQPARVDYVGYLRKLESVLIDALAVLGLPGCRAVEGLTGVWAPAMGDGQLPAKIASIGVKVDARGITRHGFALNIQPDMTYWQGIIGCGLTNTTMCSLAELLPAVPSMPEAEEAVSAAFSRQFGLRMIPDSS